MAPGGLRQYVWGFGAVRRSVALALVSGWVLTEYARPTHAIHDTVALLGYSLLFLSLVTGIGVLLWARSLLGAARPPVVRAWAC